MHEALATAQLNRYPQDPVRMGRGLVISAGLHIFVGMVICLITYFLGIQSLKQLLEKGSIATSGPAPQPVVIQIKLEEVKPPPTDHIEWIKQVLKPKPIVIVKPPPVPKPKPKPVVAKATPRYTAPKATGAGVSKTISALVVGSEGLPKPAYDYEEQLARETGVVQMHVVFDSSGGVSSAQVTSSSGHSDLDASTREFILSNWKQAAYAGKTYDVPIRWQLQ